MLMLMLQKTPNSSDIQYVMLVGHPKAIAMLMLMLLLMLMLMLMLMMTLMLMLTRMLMLMLMLMPKPILVLLILLSRCQCECYCYAELMLMQLRMLILMLIPMLMLMLTLLLMLMLMLRYANAYANRFSQLFWGAGARVTRCDAYNYSEVRRKIFARFFNYSEVLGRGPRGSMLTIILKRLQLFWGAGARVKR